MCGRERRDREGGRKGEKGKEGRRFSQAFVHQHTCISTYQLQLLPTHQLNINIPVAEINNNVSQCERVVHPSGVREVKVELATNMLHKHYGLQCIDVVRQVVLEGVEGKKKREGEREREREEERERRESQKNVCTLGRGESYSKEAHKIHVCVLGEEDREK